MVHPPPPLEIYLQPFCLVFSNSSGLFQQGWVLAFINVYKHYGSIAVDLDPRSKIQDFRKNFLDPRSGSKIQDPRLQKKLLGSKVWIQDPRSKIPEKTSWIRRQSFPRSETRFCCGSKKFFLESWILDLGSRPWIQEVFSVILDLGSRPWIQEVFPKILDLGSWIQINCYGSIVFINVYKRLEICQNPPFPEKGCREGPKRLNFASSEQTPIYILQSQFSPFP